ncbi:unnamed protein product [Zymoseptoria tritici ST99CH_3D1]|uniref:Secreted chloroperoxidase n=2 Tax=Zymoseptoria tritici TaxID=1047171 RepID=F9XIW4_ZYMTI|nr:secreted chloroperoxidase [Zymoseptoria tritici IPO323]EGP84401.1 secreted chloroperoxidase [Zymoseptoria tritici IPO323]SMR58569.1 unnamed protein product [Zymoseptoria tritici ST99CH_1E4]SMR61562.1 unnamed protein product [Zymoseptoria tritici ST99CH_3D1]
MKTVIASSLLLAGASAFPFVATADGVDSSLLHAERQRLRRQQPGQGNGGAATCPFNANHKPAAPVTAQFPYNNAKNGKKGNEKGGFLVPDPNDKAHQFVAPDYSKDIRGPCPGLNAAANHNFLAHDGVVTYNELVDAQQNVYNVGYDLANLLAILGLTVTDGDLVTEKLSIGCDATSRTSFNPILTGSEPGLDGHNKFEGDSSLTRNDFFTANGDNFSFNGTLFGHMTRTTGGNYDLKGLAQYRYERYQESRAQNPNFYFGPLALLLYGAASFLYELMPSGTRNYAPDVYTISSFFGAEQNADGSWRFNGKERIPDNWTNRVNPYTIFNVGQQIFEMYGLHPVEFGGNTGSGSFNGGLNFESIQNGQFKPADPKAASCFLYMLTTERVPSYFNSVLTPTVESLSFAASKLSGTDFANLGCPRPLTK